MPHIVVIENDGKKPSSQYYINRHKLALWVRETDQIISRMKGSSVVAGRYSGQEGRGVIIQEGCVITPSWSQARAIAMLARNEGIESVWVGTTDLESYNPDPGDLEAYERIQEVFSRKGRPPKAIGWVATCFEDMNTYAVDAPSVVLCPNCGGTNIRTRIGVVEPILDETEVTKDVFDFWLRSRFFTGYFEIPRLSAGPVQKTTRAELAPFALEAEGKAVEALRNSPDIQAILNPDLGLDVQAQMELLDDAIGALVYTASQVRDQGRDQSIITYLTQGGDSSAINIAHNPDAPDLFELAAIATPPYIAGLVGQIVRLRKDGAL